MSLKVGSFIEAKLACCPRTIYLFVVAEKLKGTNHKYFCVKCNWRTKKPIINTEYYSVAFSETGAGVSYLGGVEDDLPDMKWTSDMIEIGEP